MMFDWVSFLKKYRIPFTIGGKDVSRNNLGISCPFCNEDKTKTHLGVNPSTGYWNCWKCSNRGRQPIRLVQALLHCSYNEALQIINEATQSNITEFDTIFNALAGKVTFKNKLEPQTKLEFPNNFYPITSTGLSKPYYNYLCTRNFEKDDVSKVIKYYDLRHAITGFFARRIIIPINFHGLVGWTGRAISINDKLRYLSLSPKKENAEKNNVPQALKTINETLFLYDNWINDYAHTLYVCEGPFDALKIDYYGKEHGVRATCLYTANATDTQKYLIYQLSSKFKNIYIMFDNEYFLKAMRVSDSILANNVVAKELPQGFKDSGEMSKKDVLRTCIL